MEPTSFAGTALVIAKLGAFALIVHASRRATLDAREAEARRKAREAEEQAATARRAAAAEAGPVREAA